MCYVTEQKLNKAGKNFSLLILRFVGLLEAEKLFNSDDLSEYLPAIF